MNIENVFHSYPLEQLKGFGNIACLSRKLCTMPQEKVLHEFYSKLKEDQKKEPREELDREPNYQLALKEEALSVLLNKSPNFAHNKEGIQKQMPDEDEWLLRRGFLYRSTKKGDIKALQKTVSSFFHQECKCAVNVLYPKGGYRYWHTNKYNANGWVMFLVHTQGTEQSFFRYIHPDTKELVTCYDTPACVNFFHLNANNLLWHCIAADETNRWSQGFFVPSNWQGYIEINDC